MDFHREQADHFDFVSDYGTDDTASYCSGSVADSGTTRSSSGLGEGGNINVGGRVGVCEGKCCDGKCNTLSAAPSTTMTVNNVRHSSGRMNTNNNNYHCYGNQLHASWYEGDDEEEKGLLRN